MTSCPLPSHLPKDIANLAISFQESDEAVANVLSTTDLEDLQAFHTAANYIAAAMIFLKKNVLLQDKLEKDHIKERLLGHWGSCPGISFVYSHCNLLIKKYDIDLILVTGPGHGAPAILAGLYLEGSLGHFYPDYSTDFKGLEKLISKFSVPGGFPSHVNAQLPGQILEGGELGYALSTSFGAVMDKPDLIVTCIVGDGEAETGPTATAWHAHKYIDPKESGAVLPILHCNGFKIAERTIFGCMDDAELAALFSGYGYHPCIVKYENDVQVNKVMAQAMNWAYQEIRHIQKAARTGNPITKPRWPMIVMKTPKGWSGPKELGGKLIEGSWRSHQVPLPGAKSDETQFTKLEKWLKSYKPENLFNSHADDVRRESIIRIIPGKPSKRLGMRREVFAGVQPLKVPDWSQYSFKRGEKINAMAATGDLLTEVMKVNPHKFRIVSPDELSSNKLDKVLEVTSRNFQVDPETLHKGGQVTEMLSEHTLQGFMQGYVLTGRVALFPSYESFLGIVTTMTIQYAKFMKMAKETPWRQDVGSLNYIETSTLWRQEHNGFSHQNPGFIDSLLALKPDIVRIYLPPDANCFVCTMAHCLRSKNYINLMVGSKVPNPCWLTPEEAERHCIAGASVWKFASTDGGVDPDVILVGIGVEVTFEVVAAAALLRKNNPDVRVRVVNVTDLMVLGPEGSHPHALSKHAFESLFTKDKPVVINFHGYPTSIKTLLFGRSFVDTSRIDIHGYMEEGTTTTPFAMLTLNNTSRFDLAVSALRGVNRWDSHEWISMYQHEKRKNDQYILEYGYDQAFLSETPTFD